MNRIERTVLSIVLAALPGVIGVAEAQTPDELAAAPTWQAPSAEQVKTQATEWLDQRQADEATKAQAAELWSSLGEDPTADELLTCLIETFALADKEIVDLTALCAKPKEQVVLPDRPWLGDPNTAPLVANNVRLFYARWLVHEEMYDEAHEQIASLGPEDVVDPASLLFYQSVVSHTLVDKEAGLESIAKLLEGPEDTPRRYVAVAQLMQQDLIMLEDDTLDHIARRMSDIERRLELGRAGERVRKVEDGVIESLDKLIKKLEEEQKKKQQQGSGGNNIQSNNPAPDSKPMGGKGHGRVTRRDIGSKSGWGDLPPKEREEALQQINREMPSHYSKAIEQYFRRLAAEGLD